MAATNDTRMAEGSVKHLHATDYSDILQTPYSDAFAFSDAEQDALELYDQLRELELEKSLTAALHNVHEADVSALSDDELQQHLITAEREAMEAKAKFEIRNRISHSAFVMDPFLKAIHGGQQHTLEKRMLPLITENDALSMLHGILASRLASTTHALSSVEQNNITALDENRELSRKMLKLADKVKAQSVDDLGDHGLRQQVESAEKDVKDSRKRAKTLKGIISAMIVGSGINWAADEELRDLVLDDEDDG